MFTLNSDELKKGIPVEIFTSGILTYAQETGKTLMGEIPRNILYIKTQKYDLFLKSFTCNIRGESFKSPAIEINEDGIEEKIDIKTYFNKCFFIENNKILIIREKSNLMQNQYKIIVFKNGEIKIEECFDNNFKNKHIFTKTASDNDVSFKSLALSNITALDVPNLLNNASSWWLNGEVGSSSKFLVYSLLPFSVPDFMEIPAPSYPHDLDDFSRIYKLFKFCPELKLLLTEQRKKEIIECSPNFSGYLNNLDKMLEMYENLDLNKDKDLNKNKLVNLIDSFDLNRKITTKIKL